MRRDGPDEGDVSFGPFRLVPSARLRERDDIPVQIGGRALDGLILLVAHAGDVVGKRDLVCHAWSGITVDG